MSTLDLGLIGNSRTNALIDKNASIVWWCYPYFDSDPLCNALLAGEQTEDSHGRIDVLFADSRMVEQRYERNSAILVTRFEDNAGNAIEVTDFAPRFRASAGSSSCSAMATRKPLRISVRR